MADATADEIANLSVQEREMLQYLEDLQSTNPAEYQMLVQQLQSRGGGAAAANGDAASAGKNGGPSSVEVIPKPGFVAKTRSFTKRGQKVFVNVCQSDHVDPPAPVEPPPGAPPSDEVQMRIPLSLGPPREDLDKDGGVCTVYDVVFHPDTVANALQEAEFRNFMLELVRHQVKEKHKDELSDQFGFPKLKGNYKGIAPLPQIMRRKGVPPPSAAAAADGASANGAIANGGASAAASPKLRSFTTRRPTARWRCRCPRRRRASSRPLPPTARRYGRRRRRRGLPEREGTAGGGARVGAGGVALERGARGEGTVQMRVAAAAPPRRSHNLGEVRERATDPGAAAHYVEKESGPTMAAAPTATRRPTGGGGACAAADDDDEAARRERDAAAEGSAAKEGGGGEEGRRVDGAGAEAAEPPPPPPTPPPTPMRRSRRRTRRRRRRRRRRRQRERRRRTPRRRRRKRRRRGSGSCAQLAQDLEP